MKTEKQLIEEGVITTLIIRRLNKFIDEFFEFDYLEGRLEAKALQISRRGRLVELELMYEEHQLLVLAEKLFVFCRCFRLVRHNRNDGGKFVDGNLPYVQVGDNFARAQPQCGLI
jgi:hypothetical protein